MCVAPANLHAFGGGAVISRRAIAAAMSGVASLSLVFAGQVLAKSDAPSGDPKKGRELFINLPCATCHTLKDAGASGQVGPVLDGDTNLTVALIINRVTNGQGAMPAFGDQLSAQDIADLAAYVMQASR